MDQGRGIRLRVTRMGPNDARALLLMTHSTAFALVLAGTIAMFASACGRAPHGGWEKLAEHSDSSGNRYVVAQQHYDWIEGWRVSFTLVSSDRKIYGSLLAMKSRRWGMSRITERGQLVKVWREEQVIAVFDTVSRTFTNYLNNSVDRYVDGFNEVQGKAVRTNLYFDTQ